MLQAYKIVWLMEVFQGKQITKMYFEFVRQDSNRYYIIDVGCIHYREQDP